MKKLHVLFLFLFIQPCVFSQEELLDSEGDSVFNSAQGVQKINESAKTSFVFGPGFSMDANYSLGLGVFPGFSETPWNFKDPWRYNEKSETFDTIIGASMEASLSLDIQPSSVLRIRQTITFSIPESQGNEIPILFKEFFVDYNLLNIAYFKAGKFDIKWGVSPNYPYTDLLSRLPSDIESPGSAYNLKMDVPIGIGGLQFVVIARNELLAETKKPRIEEFGYGLKFNFAIPFIDVDMGVFGQKLLPLRSFISARKTLFKNTELYAEGMLTYKNLNLFNWSGEEIEYLFSYNAGFLQPFFSDKLNINMEFFYDAEETDYSVTKNKLKTDEDDKTPLFSGFNAAANLIFNPGIFLNPIFFVNLLYSYNSASAQATAGLRIEPLKHLKLFFTVTTALGERGEESYYYENADIVNRPFAFAIIAMINGIYNFNHFE